MALAAASVFEGRAAGWLVGAAVVDHALQPGSALVADEVANRLALMGCEPVEVLSIVVAGSGGPEAAARDARYQALDELAAKWGATVLLGHTRDDQAETVLLGLARGSGVRSLAGMPSRRGRFRRPLLAVPRALTVEACAALGLHVWQDPHNADYRFARSRVRHEVLPMLERELGPGVVQALARTAALARLDADALDSMADALYRSCLVATDGLAVDALVGAVPALRRRALRLAALAAGSPAGELTARHVDEIDLLVTDWHGQQKVSLPGHVTAQRSAGVLSFSRS